MGIDPTRGFVAFPRGLTEWGWYTEPNTARLFFHLLLTANWQEKQWQGITIHPGELVTSQSQLAKQLGLSRPECPDGSGAPTGDRVSDSQNRVEIQRHINQ